MRPQHSRRSAWLTLAVVLIAQPLLAGASAAVVPGQTNFQGLLLDAAGDPLNGVVDLELRLYDADTGGNLLWSESHFDVQVVDGVYDVVMGGGTAIPDSVFEIGTLHLEVEVEGETLAPRRPILAVPYARRAAIAESIDGPSGTVVAQIFEYYDFDGGDPPNDDPSEGLADVDGDGMANFIDSDNDGDGYSDTQELAQGSDINLTTPQVLSYAPPTLTVTDSGASLALQVNGSNFAPGLVFTLGGQSPTPQNVTSGSFDVTVAAEPEGLATGIVTLPNGETGSRTIQFDYPTPTITGFTPAYAPNDVATQVTVEGTNFFPGLSVAFGTESPTPTNLTSTSFDVEVGPQASGPATVQVTLANGKSASTSFPFLVPKKVFVTSQTSTGNLGGLISGADAICATAASNAGLLGSYLAWLGGTPGNNSPAHRFTKTFLYRRTDGVPIAMNFADLTDGSIDAPIDHDEFGSQIASITRVWSNVDPASGFALTSTDDCSDWTSAITSGRRGLTTATDSTWSETGLLHCSNLARLYCFQQ